MTHNKLLLLALGPALVCLALAGCTPSAANSPPTASPTSSASPTTAAPTVSATPTVTATPTPTLDADQIDALEVARSYSAAMTKIRSEPIYSEQKMISLLKPLAYDDMIQANLNFMADWRAKGWRDNGTITTVTEQASKPATSDGTTRVTVTLCKDQSEVDVVDKNGKPVTAEAAQFPDFLESRYDLRRGDGGKTFKVYEIGGEEVARCA